MAVAVHPSVAQMRRCRLIIPGVLWALQNSLLPPLNPNPGFRLQLEPLHRLDLRLIIPLILSFTHATGPNLVPFASKREQQRAREREAMIDGHSSVTSRSLSRVAVVVLLRNGRQRLFLPRVLLLLSHLRHSPKVCSLPLLYTMYDSDFSQPECYCWLCSVRQRLFSPRVLLLLPHAHHSSKAYWYSLLCCCGMHEATFLIQVLVLLLHTHPLS